MKSLVGTDIIEVDRIKEALEDERFTLRVFTDKEIDYCEKKGRSKYQHYAVRFAAKEAVFKAISPLFNNKYEIGWKNIEIINDKNGRPFVNFIGIEINNISMDISLSHIEKYATATAIAVVD